MAALARHRVPDGCPLSPLEFQALELLAEGLTYKQIARRTSSRPTAIRGRAHRAYQRLGVPDRTQAVIVALRNGWLARTEPVVQPTRPPAQVEREPPLTYCQQRYNEALDRWLRTRSRADDHAMRVWLDGMHLEKGLTPPSLERRGERPVSDWLDHLRHDRRIT